MTVNTKISAISALSGEALAVLVPEDKTQFAAATTPLKKIFHAPLENLLASGDFTGKKDSVCIVYGTKKMQRLILIGLGKASEITQERLRRAAASAAKTAQKVKAKSLHIQFPATSLSTEDAAQALTEGANLSLYKFDKYFTYKNDKDKPSKLKEVVLVSSNKADEKDLKKGARNGQIISEGVCFTRDLANAPANEIYPETLAAQAAESGKKYGFNVTILEKKKIEEHGMGGLLGVNAGSASARPPRFIIMEWNGGAEGDKPFVIVGKGITFDSGGISLKPGAGMADMKMDMHGAATVIGTLQTVARLKLPVNVVGLVPTTENMPSGSATRPGDVLRHMNGVTSEVDNTDAEGRLVLADALSYADKYYKPQAVVDLATLTGACVIALGQHATGMMGNNDELKAKLKVAGDRTYERVCELPLYEEYEDQIKSDIADVKNVGGRSAGAITAGLFLKRFVGDWPWVHLDIAGTGMAEREMHYAPKGGTGVGVRMLTDVLRNWKS
ncbi:MAG TPA: leucyl aminopeptidase [Candidatus Kapabacteria bacterium]|nr:leucyl aminopeptidase [Candidatus Kapabacteria bacterium]